MNRVIRALRIALACTVLWVSLPAHAAANARASVTCVAAIQSGEDRSTGARSESQRQQARRVRSRSSRLEAGARAARKVAPRDPCTPRTASPPKRERVYLKHCVLLR